VKKLLKTIRNVQENNHIEFHFLGVGTTGSGRELIGKLTKADLILNEISAHALGAMDINPEITTVFEIGGQDSKYMQMKKGILVDSNMNYVCAAGTGSFIEEQARKLEYSVKEIGDEVMGVEPPVTSDRCTVFMEQDIRKMLKKGYSRIEVLGATMYSIVQNYLTKVVGNRKVDPEKVLFLGATARNKGLVAAFEQLLGVEVIVPPFCHVMGAYGVCLKLMEKMKTDSYESTFDGLKFIDEKFHIQETTCKFCQNYCRITSISSDDMQDVSWGYMCGREPGEEKKKQIPEFEMFEVRDRLLFGYKKPIDPHRQTIGIPLSLQTYTFLPMWMTFFEKLGFNTVLSRKTDGNIASRGASLSAADFCFPVKVALGHVAELLESAKTDYVFVPAVMEYSLNEATNRSWFCPCTIYEDVYARGVFKDHADFDKLFYAPLNMNWSEELLEGHFVMKISEKLGVEKERVFDALREGLAAQKGFEMECQEVGRQYLERVIQEGRTCFVFIGRPYNTHDYGINFMLPQKVASYGYPVIPIDFIPFNEKTREELGEGYQNLFWYYGQKIINAIEYVRKIENLYPIYVTNFNCGLDSYILSYAENSIGDKSMLELEFDEHSSPTGYITRLEAFFDTLEGNPKQKAEKYLAQLDLVPISAVDPSEEILLPYNPEQLPSIYASVLQRYGYNVRLLMPTQDTYDIGLKYSRGTECGPAIAVMGVFARELEKNPSDHINIGIGTTYGPCRYGQYVNMMNNHLKKFPNKKITFVSADLSLGVSDSFTSDLKMEVFRGVLVLDILKRMLYKTRPYEKRTGQTDLVYEKHRELLLSAIRSGDSLDASIVKALEEFKGIEVDRSAKKLLVAVVGESSVRCDAYINQDLLKIIEDNGGEIWHMNMTEWLIWGTSRTTPAYGEYLWKDDNHLDIDRIVTGMEMEQERMLDLCGDFLADRHEPHMAEVYEAAEEYVDRTCASETLTIAGRSVLFAKRDHADLVVNVKPFSCLPGNVTEAILNRIKIDVNVPIITITYERGGDPNAPVRTMLQNLKKRVGQ
jgi:predicted CoA-substrate-specific enzyme activase